MGIHIRKAGLKRRTEKEIQEGERRKKKKERKQSRPEYPAAAHGYHQ
jgi:hypothetical protein